MAQCLMNSTSIHEDVGLSLASLSGLRIRHCCELWCKSQAWLWLWCRSAAVADSFPSLGTSICCRCSPKKAKKKKKKKIHSQAKIYKIYLNQKDTEFSI